MTAFSRFVLVTAFLMIGVARAATVATVPLNLTFYSAARCTVNSASSTASGGQTSCTMCTPTLAAGSYTVPTLRGFATTSTTTCADVDVLTSSKDSYVRRLIGDAKAFLTASLSFRAPTSTVSTTAQALCSGSATLPLPSPFSTSAVDASSVFHIVWTAVPLSVSNDDPRVFMWSTTCQSDTTSGRAVIVHLNFVPAMLFNADYNNALAYQNDLDSLIHELVHVMGFSTTAFSKRGVWSLANAWDTTSSPIASRYTSGLSSSVTYVSSPRVLQAVRAFTGCATDLGAQIEDVNAIAVDTKLHWKMRVFPQDAMTAERATTLRFHSNLTLSFLEDTGLYVRISGATPWANSMAQITFGAGWGCTFLSTQCVYNATRGLNISGYTFSTLDAFAEGCTYDGLARGYSDAQTLTDVTVPTLYRYYGSSRNAGGSFQENDFCPIVLPYTNGACIDSSNRDSLNILGSTYGPTSRCFLSNVASQGFTDASITRCFQISCSADGVLSFLLQGYGSPIVCPTAGADITVPASSGFSGVVRCPPAATVCSHFSSPVSATSEVPLPVWSYQGNQISQMVGVASPFVSAESCESRFDSCFLPALDALWNQGRCGDVAVAFERCFGGDCIATRNRLLAESLYYSKGTQRVVPMFQVNCSDAFLSRNCIDGADGRFSYCNLARQPSSAFHQRLGSVALLMAALAVLAW